jgi:hypothetical protein
MVLETPISTLRLADFGFFTASLMSTNSGLKAKYSDVYISSSVKW